MTKHIIYTGDILKNLVHTNIKDIELVYTEEELSGMYLSEGSEYIRIAQTLTNIQIEQFFQDAFENNAMKKEYTKKIIIALENTITQMESKVNLNLLKKQIPSKEQDEMFPIDNNYNNPWWTLF